eukprot:scaffold24915_cov117-Cylindrotheca_fusiformis.AAC.2
MVFSSIETGTLVGGHSHVEVQSVLRLRPLLKKEREENVVLEPLKRVSRNAPATVVLNPPRVPVSSPAAGSLRSRADSDGTMYSTPVEFHFNHVMPESTSQDKVYYSLGLPMVTEAMGSLTRKSSTRSQKPAKSHLLISMGVSTSGKTYTCFGGSTIPKRRASQDGLVPRLVDSLFSQSKHHANGDSRGFAVQISMLQVSQTKGNDPKACKIHDLLGAAEKKKTTSIKSSSPTIKSVRSMAAKFEKALPAVASPVRSPLLRSTECAEVDPEDPHPAVQICHDETQAREVLQNGLDAGRRAAKGNQNHHLLVVLQPTVNSSQYGERIAILDMAGLEKGKRQKSRQKDVVGMNEAASGAVLNCLRTMMHNTNVQNGKGSVVDMADDLASEISCVSQEKDPYQQHMKTVPFRQHMVTMMLNPLFATSNSTKVTLLMAAYPGHADYTEKKGLLQDMELLCGSALLAADARVTTGFDRHPTIMNTILTEVDNEYEDDSTVQPSNKRQPKDKLPEESFSRSRSSSEEEDILRVERPPPYAPSFTNPASASKSEVLQPTAPEVCSPPAKKGVPKTQNFMSDFPGVDIPKTKKTAEQRHMASSGNSGGRKSETPVYRHGKGERRSISNAELNPGVVESKEQVDYPGSKDPRIPLSRSSLENIENVEQRPQSHGTKYEHTHTQAFSTARKLQTSIVQERVVIKEQRLKKRGTPSKSEHRSKTKQEPTDRSQYHGRDDQEIRIQELETKMQEIIQQKRATDKKNSELQEENDRMKCMLKEAGRQGKRRVWTSKDEEDFQENRKLRLEDQTLVKAPLFAHLKHVDYIYDIKNQWAMSDKPQFDLQFPSQFQRAPDLDIRDKIMEEREAAILKTAGTPKKESNNFRKASLRRSGLFGGRHQ